MAADIICLTQFALFLYHINTFGMIIHIQPVSHIFAITIYWKLLALQCIIDNQWNQFFWKLIRPIIIRTIGNICRKMISVNICLYQKIRTCLTCRIWTVWIVCCSLIKIAAILLQRTIDFICGHMQKFLALFKSSIFLFPGFLGTV